MELARQAVLAHPHLRVIFASGHVVSKAADLIFAWTALQKAFDADQLFGTVEKISREQPTAWSGAPRDRVTPIARSAI